MPYYSREIINDIVEYLNGDGGVIYIGMYENGTVIGVRDAEAIEEAARSDIERIHPDAQQLIQMKRVPIGGALMLAIMAARGTEKPYSCASADTAYERYSDEAVGEHFTQAGFQAAPQPEPKPAPQIAQQTRSQPEYQEAPKIAEQTKPQPEYQKAPPTEPKASKTEPKAPKTEQQAPRSEQRDMSAGAVADIAFPEQEIPFEEQTSAQQQLSLRTFINAMQACEISTDEKQLEALGLINGGAYTNLALLLSEQCRHSIMLVQYESSDKSELVGSERLSGSVLTQLAKVFRRMEKYAPSYPQEAVREAILNSAAHRDYRYSGSTIVNIFSDKIEVISPGGLHAGVSMAAIELGLCQSGNPRLAEILSVMELINGCGTGISRIKREYSAYKASPLFESAQGVFKVTLPDVNSDTHSSAVPDSPKAQVISLTKKRGYIVRSDVEEITGLKTTAAYNLLKELCSEGSLVAEGTGKKTIYRIK